MRNILTHGQISCLTDRNLICIRYADDIVLLAKSKRASERLLESSTKYLEERLKLTVNREKSRTVSVFAIRNFKFLGFAYGVASIKNNIDDIPSDYKLILKYMESI